MLYLPYYELVVNEKSSFYYFCMAEESIPSAQSEPSVTHTSDEILIKDGLHGERMNAISTVDPNLVDDGTFKSIGCRDCHAYIRESVQVWCDARAKRGRGRGWSHETWCRRVHRALVVL